MKESCLHLNLRSVFAFKLSSSQLQGAVQVQLHVLRGHGSLAEPAASSLSRQLNFYSVRNSVLRV